MIDFFCVPSVVLLALPGLVELDAPPSRDWQLEKRTEHAERD
jgi:hypothetical protein